MTFDALILAGGIGTRLKGLWDGPKCLVPVGGTPVLERLLTMLEPLQPGYVALALGVKRDAVQAFLKTRPEPSAFKLVRSLEPWPRGTSAAVRRSLRKGLVGGPLLVLNGDTVPGYDLGMLLSFHEMGNAWATAAMTTSADPWRNTYAGACVLSDRALDEIEADKRTRDFPAHLLGAQPFIVSSFLDVGTPEGFQRAKEWNDGS